MSYRRNVGGSSALAAFETEKKGKTMNTIDTLREFFGWCSIINIVLLTLSSILIIAVRGSVSRIHGKMFNMDENDISKEYFHYLGQYKIATLVFSIAPYFALKIMS